MRKLRLDLESLEVESFKTTPGVLRRRGTVHGAGTQDPYTVVIPDTQLTCLDSDFDCSGGGSFCAGTDQGCVDYTAPGGCTTYNNGGC